MGYQQSSALHIHRFDYSETSQIATFFTRSSGKVRAIAKGARREKNSFDGPIDLLKRSRITWIQRPPDRLSILTKCEQNDPLRTLRTDPQKMVYGFWIIFLLNRLTAYGQPNRGLFDHAADFLEVLKSSADARRNCVYFDLFTLSHLGQLPRLSQCVLCETSVRNIHRLLFSYHAGGVLCSSCRNRVKQEQSENAQDRPRADHMNLRSPSPGTLRALSAVLNSDQPFRGTDAVQLSNRQLKEARRLLNHCYRYLLGYNPDLLSEL